VLGAQTARFVTETPADLGAPSSLPCARVSQYGGGSDGQRLLYPRLTIDCFAADSASSREFALTVNDAMFALVGLVINGATISHVIHDSGPLALDYVNKDVRRQVLNYQVFVKTD
jgi:hypothetical protein